MVYYPEYMKEGLKDAGFLYYSSGISPVRQASLSPVQGFFAVRGS